VNLRRRTRYLPGVDSARRSLGDRVEDARRRAFVGRRAELALFVDVLAGSGLVHLSGEGGVGKTTLVREWIALARDAGRTVVHLDGRDVDATPAGFEEAVRRACGVDDARDPFDELAEPVLVVDGFEHLAALERWLREAYLPFLPGEAVVVLAGRKPPDRAWTTDPGWRDVLRPVRLDPLGSDDSTALLEVWGVTDPAVRHQLASLGRGHPLALTLLALTGRADAAPPTLSSAPEVVAELLHTFVDDVPDPVLRRALLTCAHSWLTTEDLLGAVLGADEAGRAWTWLSGLSFVVRAPRGIYPHELARDVVDTDFRHRSPEEYAEVHRAVRRHVVSRLRHGSEQERHGYALQLFFLHHESPMAAPMWVARTGGAGLPEPATSADRPEILAMHDAAVADRLSHALDDPAYRTWVLRDASGVVAHVTRADLADVAAEDIASDPVLEAVAGHVATSPARPGERVAVYRYYGGRDGPRSLPSLALNATVAMEQFLTLPLAWAWIVSPDPEFVGPFMDHIAFEALVRRDGLVGYGMDWRRLSPDDWIDLMVERELTGGSGPPPPERLRPAPLGREAFAAAVRALLGDLDRDDRVRTNPLATSRLGSVDPSAHAEALRCAVRRALDVVAGERRGDVLARVLERTYLRGAPTQEAAAEMLGLPFSTYRRHLGRGVDRLTDVLWAAEIGEIDLAANGQELSTD
jgi:hypothetical protein